MTRHSNWKEVATALAAGSLFGAGLIVSGMVDPGKVLAFLDITGAWDPSLALVMGAALAVGLPGFRYVAGRTQSVLGLPMRLPTNRHVDRSLVAGAILFGVGWGLVGLCPGPALVAVGTGSPKAMLFAAAMLAGMGFHEWIGPKRLVWR